MLTKHDREKIRASLEEMTKHGNGNGSPAMAQRRLTPHQIWQLLDAVDDAEAEIEHLRMLIRKLYKIVNLATLSKCDHKCFTTRTRNNLFALLAEAHAVAAPTRNTTANLLPDS